MKPCATCRWRHMTYTELWGHIRQTQIEWHCTLQTAVLLIVKSIKVVKVKVRQKLFPMEGHMMTICATWLWARSFCCKRRDWDSWRTWAGTNATSVSGLTLEAVLWSHRRTSYISGTTGHHLSNLLSNGPQNEGFCSVLASVLQTWDWFKKRFKATHTHTHTGTRAGLTQS